MEKFNNNLTNENKEQQENVLLRVFLQRHGPKLYASGEKNETAVYFGTSVEKGYEAMNFEKGKGLVHIYSSPILRAQKTAAIGLEKVSNTEHRYKNKVLENKDLGTPFKEDSDDKYSQDYKTLVNLQTQFELLAREKVENEQPNLNAEDKETKIKNTIDVDLLSLLFNNQEGQKHGLQTTYEEIADNLANRYSKYLKHMGLLNSLKEKSDLQPANEPYTQIDVSHSFPIMCLLKKYLVFSSGVAAKELSAKEFFKLTGGVIKESDSIELDYVPQGDKYIVKVKGNGFTGELNFN